MMAIVETYLATRRAGGFDLLNAGYLLGSFACFAAKRNETHIRAETAIDWAALGPSVAQRDARLKTVCCFARYIRAQDRRRELPPSELFWQPQEAPSPIHLLDHGDHPPH
jgi:integrase/recombinase XerD